MCGWTLARAHARSGDAIAIGSYLGSNDSFEGAIAEFSRLYADRNEEDFAALRAAIESGRLQAEDA
jgi:predicted alpha/beta hydrolase